MKTLLILFAKGFPFQISEPFLENEYLLYKEYFDKVLLITACRRGEQPTRSLEGSSIELLEDYILSKDFRSVCKALPWLLTDRMFYTELKALFHKGVSRKRLHDLLAIALCGNHRAMLTYQWLKAHPEYQVSVLYSYWMQIPAYGALRLKAKLRMKDLRSVSRCHGYDIFSERHSSGYIPFQQQFIRKLDYIAAVSKDGASYLKAKYPEAESIHTCYLGAADRNQRNPYTGRTPLQIVSCARVIPLKRLKRIADALSCIRAFPICWTHLGGGEGLEELIAYAKERLSCNPAVCTCFAGMLSNQQIYQYYQEHEFHVFLSVSASEGLPVSICEALSFGIPLIATAVGGQSETIAEGRNGYLLDKDYKDEELAGRIVQIAVMPETDYLAMRTNARSVFEKNFRAAVNNRRFIEHVLLQNQTIQEYSSYTSEVQTKS